MIRSSLFCVLASIVLAAALVATAPAANAQCSTCPAPTVAYYQPTVAYQPVAVQPVRRGWYLGRFFDRMRMRSWGFSTVPATTYTAAYAPYTAAYTPYTAAYAYSAAYRPYVTAYAPLATTSYYVPATTTVARQVVMSPVISPCNACGCNPCGCGVSTCSACTSCSPGMSQAIYSTPSSGCSTCAPAAGTPIYSESPSVGRQTPQPSLAPDEAVPGSTQYDTQRPATADPAPLTEEDSNTYFEAPRLFNPRDRTASDRPTAGLHHAVYRQQANHQTVSHAAEPEVDANGWYAVSASR